MKLIKFLFSDYDLNNYSTQKSKIKLINNESFNIPSDIVINSNNFSSLNEKETIEKNLESVNKVKKKIIKK